MTPRRDLWILSPVIEQNNVCSAAWTGAFEFKFFMGVAIPLLTYNLLTNIWSDDSSLKLHDVYYKNNVSNFTGDSFSTISLAKNFVQEVSNGVCREKMVKRFS